MEPCLWTFRDENGVIHALCLVYGWRAVTLHLENMSLRASTVCTNGECGSHECSDNAAHTSLKRTINTLEHGADLRPISQNT